MAEKIRVEDLIVHIGWRFIDGEIFIEVGKVTNRKDNLRILLLCPELPIVEPHYN